MVFVKIVNPLRVIFYSFGEIFIVVNGQILKKQSIWSHCMSGSGLHDFHNRVKASQGLGSVRNDDRDQISSKVDQKLTPLNPFSRVRASKLSNLFKRV